MTDKDCLLQIVKDIAKIAEMHKQAFTETSQLLVKITEQVYGREVFPTIPVSEEKEDKKVPIQQQKGMSTADFIPNIPVPSKAELESHTIKWEKFSS